MATAEFRCNADAVQTIEHTPVAAVAVDTVTVINSRVTFAYADVEANERGAFVIGAPDVDVPTAAVDITEGDAMYWDATASLFTNVVASNTKCGYFRAAALAADASARAALVPSL